MTWNTNIQEAPRGRTVTVMRNTKTRNGIERVPVKEFEIDPVWLATKCGKVVRSYWIPETDKNAGRWAGFATAEEPIAWQEYVVPVHPDKLSEMREYTKATVASIIGADDCGSGA